MIAAPDCRSASSETSDASSRSISRSRPRTPSARSSSIASSSAGNSTQWAGQPYWLIKTGEKGRPASTAACCRAEARGRPTWPPSTRIVCTIDVADLRRDGRKGGRGVGGIDRGAEDADSDGGLARLRQGHRRQPLRHDADGCQGANEAGSDSPCRHRAAPATIATRESALALWQAEHIRARLAAHVSGACEVDLLGMTTQGDRVLDRPLADDRRQGAVHQGARSGDGRRPRRPRRAFAQGRADGHAAPASRSPAITAREDPRDAFVSNRFARARGTAGGRASSARRACAAKRSCASAIRCSSIEPLRGNVNTRLRKLDEGRYDAIILAAAGLKRLGFGERIAAYARSRRQPARAGAGRAGASNAAPIAPTSSPRSRRSPTATRRSRRRRSARSRARCAGSCHTPLAAYAEWADGRAVAARAAREPRRRDSPARRASRRAVDDAEAADALGRALADEFLARGAARFVAAESTRRARCERASADAAPRNRAGRSAGAASSSRGRRGRRRLRAEDRGAGRHADHLSGDRDPAARRSGAARARAGALARLRLSRSSSPPTPSNMACRDPRRWPAHARRLRARARERRRRSQRSASPTCAFRATTFDSEGLLALPELADVRRQAHRDLSRRRRARAAGRRAARARRAGRLRRLLSARDARERRGGTQRGVARRARRTR